MRDYRLWVIVAGVAAVIVLFLLLRPTDDDEAATTTTAAATTAATTAETTTVTETLTETAPGVTVTEEQPATTAPADGVQRFSARIEGGTVVGGIQRWDVAQGDDVRIVIRSDVDDEIHLHGYDLEQPVGPGKPATFAFGATIPGRFELESHEGGGQIAQLDVQP